MFKGVDIYIQIRNIFRKHFSACRHFEYYRKAQNESPTNDIQLFDMDTNLYYYI